MRTLVCYFSETGNTRRVAEAIHAALEGEKALLSMSAVESLAGWDLAFVGLPVREFGPAEPARAFLAEKVAGKKVALFVTHATASDDPEPGVRKLLARTLERCRRAAVGAEVLGLFDCRGELSAAKAAEMAASDNELLQVFAKVRDETRGHPDAQDLDAARAFARDIEKICRG